MLKFKPETDLIFASLNSQEVLVLKTEQIPSKTGKHGHKAYINVHYALNIVDVDADGNILHAGINSASEIHFERTDSSLRIYRQAVPIDDPSALKHLLAVHIKNGIDNLRSERRSELKFLIEENKKNEISQRKAVISDLESLQADLGYMVKKLQNPDLTYIPQNPLECHMVDEVKKRLSQLQLLMDQNRQFESIFNSQYGGLWKLFF